MGPRESKKMADKDELTVEESLGALSEALGKASTDLCAVRDAVDSARADMASRNSSHARSIIKDAERAIDRLREADETLCKVIEDLKRTE